MTKEQAMARASEYLNGHEMPHPNYVWVMAKPKDCGDKWYFDFKFKHKGDLPQEQWDGFGGAPGFTVSKESGEIEVVPNSEYPLKGCEE